ncbi:hypothetical protein JD844_034263 [Phrynosoma platyrhinos]|uniref:Uncharacterized protein n=1 Tax=Phrynosoma platyrhinos TaxID=52577 RepID=A0ABQ7T841_PHRPL|nr:hypothetical protein JD844_034263 [Phrynosoma platyrhinos]
MYFIGQDPSNAFCRMRSVSFSPKELSSFAFLPFTNHVSLTEILKIKSKCVSLIEILLAFVPFHRMCFIDRDPEKSKMANKGGERQRDRTLPPASKVPPEAGSCSLGGADGETKPSRFYVQVIREEEREEKWTSGPPRSPPENPPSLSSPEKHAVKTILVDLRPILEKVTECPDLGPEESLEDSPKEGFLSPQIGGYHGEDLLDDGEDPGHGRGHQAGDATRAGPKGQGVPKDLSLPPLRACGLNPEDLKTPKESQPWRKGSTKIWQKSSPALVTLQPKLSAPLFLPKMLPKEHSPLPTRLLLWRLQETTTSDNHLLITQVLSSRREELLAEKG